MERKKEALSCFEKGFNCCQSVLWAYAQDFGLSNETALRLAGAFGGGIAGMGRNVRSSDRRPHGHRLEARNDRSSGPAGKGEEPRTGEEVHGGVHCPLRLDQMQGLVGLRAGDQRGNGARTRPRSFHDSLPQIRRTCRGSPGRDGVTHSSRRRGIASFLTFPTFVAQSRNSCDIIAPIRRIMDGIREPAVSGTFYPGNRGTSGGCRWIPEQGTSP